MNKKKLSKKNKYAIYSFSIEVGKEFKIETHIQKTEDSAWDDVGLQYAFDADSYQFASTLIRDEDGKILGSVNYNEDGWGNVNAESPWSLEIAKKLALDYCREFKNKFSKAIEEIESFD